MSDIGKRNADAMRSTLKELNIRLANIEKKVEETARTLLSLNNELQLIKAQKIKDMVAQMGSGPTV